MKRKDCAHLRDVRTYATWIGHTTFAWCTLVCTSTAVAGSVKILDRTVVGNDEVTLRDVAVLTGFSPDEAERLGDLLIVPAPQPGHQLAVPLDQIRLRIDDDGYNMARLCVGGSNHCVVTRPLQFESPRTQTASSPAQQAPTVTLRHQLVQHIEESLQSLEGQIQVHFTHSMHDLLELTSPPHTFTFEPAPHQGLGKVSFQVLIEREGQPSRREQVRAYVQVTLPVVVTQHAINRGQNIEANDVHMEHQVFSNLKKLGFTSLDHVIGQQAKRLIPVGKMIQATDVKPRDLVKRNTRVLVVSREQGIQIRFTARALESGTLDDVIRLRNENSKKTFLARVVGAGQAEALASPGKGPSHAGAHP